MNKGPIQGGIRRLGSALAMTAAGLLLCGTASADDQGVLGKKLLVKISGTPVLKTIQKDAAVHNGGAGAAATMSGSLQVYYADTPGNGANLLLPAPWFSNNGTTAKYKNAVAPAGPTAVKSATVKNAKIAKVTSRGVGGLSIAASPGPNGVIVILTVNNNGTHRMCTRFPTAGAKFIAGAKLLMKNGVAIACPPPPSCVDGIQNQDETCVDGGGVCAGCCGVNSGCAVASDCCTGTCVSGSCKCPNNLYTFTVNSNNGGSVDPAEWPGGTTAQSSHTGCSVTINRPASNIDLVCSLSDNFSVNTFVGYSGCSGTGGEDGDGCSVTSCPPAGVGSCCTGRPSCSAAWNGSGQSQYSVQCLQ